MDSDVINKAFKLLLDDYDFTCHNLNDFLRNYVIINRLSSDYNISVNEIEIDSDYLIFMKKVIDYISDINNNFSSQCILDLPIELITPDLKWYFYNF